MKRLVKEEQFGREQKRTNHCVCCRMKQCSMRKRRKGGAYHTNYSEWQFLWLIIATSHRFVRFSQHNTTLRQTLISERVFLLVSNCLIPPIILCRRLGLSADDRDLYGQQNRPLEEIQLWLHSPRVIDHGDDDSEGLMLRDRDWPSICTSSWGWPCR